MHAGKRAAGSIYCQRNRCRLRGNCVGARKRREKVLLLEKAPKVTSKTLKPILTEQIAQRCGLMTDECLSEFAFRYDNRSLSDGQRTLLAIKRSEGKRLIYKEPAQG